MADRGFMLEAAAMAAQICAHGSHLLEEPPSVPDDVLTPGNGL